MRSSDWAAAGYDLEGESGADASGGVFFFPQEAFEKYRQEAPE